MHTNSRDPTWSSRYPLPSLNSSSPWAFLCVPQRLTCEKDINLPNCHCHYHLPELTGIYWQWLIPRPYSNFLENLKIILFNSQKKKNRIQRELLILLGVFLLKSFSIVPSLFILYCWLFLRKWDQFCYIPHFLDLADGFLMVPFNWLNYP